MLLFRLSLLLIIKPKCNKFEHIPTDITFPINFSSDTGEYFSRENTKFGPLNKYVCMCVCRLIFISYYFAWFGSLDIYTYIPTANNRRVSQNVLFTLYIVR